MDGDPGDFGRIPIASKASTPRLECAEYRVSERVQAVCTQQVRPATRVPVSSKPTTSLLASWARTVSLCAATALAACAFHVSSEAVATWRPRQSDSSSAHRA